MWISGRLTIRLIADGAVSFVFVPFFTIASFALVYRLGNRPLRFTRAVDLFFVANPWLPWLAGFTALRCFLTPVQAAVMPHGLWPAVEVSFVALLAWSAWRDWRFFRDVLERPSTRATRDLILQRAIAWFCALAWFQGPAAAGLLGGAR